MARIAGIDLPRDKRVDIGLTYVFGIGRATAVHPGKSRDRSAAIRVKDLSEDQIVKLRETIERNDHDVEGDLRKELSMNIKRLVDIGTYRGLRHRKSLPVRGQRTKTNAQNAERQTVNGESQRNRPARPAPRIVVAVVGVLYERKKRQKERTQACAERVAHIQASFNNTIVTITDMSGNTIVWASAGNQGFKGSRKSTPFAAQRAGEAAAKQGDGKRDAASRCLCQWARIRTGIRHPIVAKCRTKNQSDS